MYTSWFSNKNRNVGLVDVVNCHMICQYFLAPGEKEIIYTWNRVEQFPETDQGALRQQLILKGFHFATSCSATPGDRRMLSEFGH